MGTLSAGPSVSIDTACSSSLSAITLAGSMLKLGKCKRGIITAALLTLAPSTLVMLTAASMLSPDGRCKTLDAAANGYRYPKSSQHLHSDQRCLTGFLRDKLQKIP